MPTQSNQEVKFNRGLKANMPSEKVPGTLNICTDTGEAFVDDTAEKRVQLKDTTKVSKSGDTMTGNLSMSSHKITNVADPTANTDAANLKSVKTQIDNSRYQSGTAITVDNEELTINHKNIGSAGTVGPTGNSSPAHGGTIQIPSITTDAQGHVSSKVNRTITLPKETPYTGGTSITVSGHTITHSNNATAGTVGPTANASPGYGGKFTVPQITFNNQGHVTSVNARTITLPTAQDIPEVETYTGESPISVDGTTISHDNIGSAGTVGPTQNDTLVFGENITVPSITTDAKGHVTSKTNRQITLPSAPTTVSGNAGTATRLQTARTVDGVSFNGSANITHYAVCSTAAATAAKVVSCTGFTRATGAKIAVKFSATNTAANPTLNVNNTGASAIYYRGSAISAGHLAANRTYEFIFNGTQYELVGDINTDSNTTYSAGKGLSLSGTTFNHSNSITAGTRGPSANSSPGFSGTFTVPQIVYDAQGHITSATNRTITLPSNSGLVKTSQILSSLSGASSNSYVPGAKVVADAINNLTSKINTLNTNLGNYNLKTYNANDLVSDPNSVGMNYYIEANNLPAGSIVEIPVFAGSTIKSELEEAEITNFGYMYIVRSYNGNQYYVTFIPYTNQSYIYFNSYTTTNSIGWNQYWRRITLSVYDPY